MEAFCGQECWFEVQKMYVLRVITERRRHEQRKQAQNREVGQLLHGAAAAATLQV